MNKRFFAVLMILLLSLGASLPAQAAPVTPHLQIDGIDVTSIAKPEWKHNHMMVPLRMIVESLGGSVQQSKDGILITQASHIVRVTPGRTSAMINGKTIRLDGAPYIHKGSTYVPLRFVAETMGASVSYTSGNIVITSKPLQIGKSTIKATQFEYHMTMGGVVEQVYGNAYTRQLYNILVSNKGKQVQEPDDYSWQNTIDIPGSYYKNIQYDFLDAKGKTVARYDTYYLITKMGTDPSKEYPDRLIHDVTADRWYVMKHDVVDPTQIQLNRAENNGFIVIISNTVV
ncbi:copper amine oxidase N-terminal domain-containing protein [Paenibacillus kandeliae]|uniref:copper amine oxidase N-terminal domain-containing protein n=1 Tax=Paenibacillus kandeliae TaxID=3231269 RepID=UPI003459A25D